jgi:hypothetical protein
LSKPRDRAALEMLRHIWPIHFPLGRAYSDQQALLAFRDAFAMADEWVRIGELSQPELAAIGQSKPPPAVPAAEAVVEGETK